MKVTRRDIELLRRRLDAHVEILDALPIVQADNRLAAAILGAVVAIGFPITPLAVPGELPERFPRLVASRKD